MAVSFYPNRQKGFLQLPNYNGSVLVVFERASILRKILEYFGLNTGVFWAQYWSILGSILSAYYEDENANQ